MNKQETAKLPSRTGDKPTAKGLARLESLGLKIKEPSEGQPASKVKGKQVSAAILAEIPINSIDLVVDNHRATMDPGRLSELAASMAEVGLMNAIGVCKRKRRHVLIYGHRRLQATKHLGWTKIKADIYRGLTNLQIAEMQFIENLQREDLSPVDEARGIKALIDQGQTIDLIASRIDRSVAFCRARLDLLRLNKKILPHVASGRIPLSHARLIARVGDSQKQVNLAMSAVGCSYYSSLDKAATESDYVERLDHLRREISYMMRKMGSVGWPKDTRYAGRLPCAGCPDNTNTEPILFEGITLTSKRGNCTNPRCFAAKAKAWEKDPVKQARDKAREAKQKGAKPKTGCKGGETYEQRQKQINALKKKFPWNAEQSFAVALWKHGKQVAEAIGKYIATGKAEGDCLDVAGVLLGWFLCGPCGHVSTGKTNKPIPTLAEIAAGTFLDNEALAAVWIAIAKLNDYVEPGVNYAGDVVNVPLQKDTLTEIHCLETLARHWKVEIPARPKFKDFKAKASDAEGE